MLCAEEILDLVCRYKNGETNLKDTIIIENTPLVHSLVKRYMSKTNEKEDLVQIGLYGLIKALDNFDPNFGVKFSTYAVPIILGELRRHFRDGGLIKVSRGLKEINSKANHIKNEYFTTYGEEISVKLLAEKLETNEETLILATEANLLPASLSQVVFEKDGSDITLEETISDENKQNLIDLLTLEEGIKLLSEKEKLFIKLRYYKEQTQQDIANRFMVSQVQVSRIEKSIVEKLRKYF